MRDFINEVLISYHKWRMINATSHSKQRYHINKMLLRIKSRSLNQIKRMESRRGL